MYAILNIKGKQYKVSENDKVLVDRVSDEASSKIKFDNVLFIQNEKGAAVGTPNVKGASVEAEVLEHVKDKKVIIAAVKKNGSNLKFADKQLKADKEVVLEAIKNDIDSLKFADKKIIKWFESLSLWSRDQLLGLNKDKDPFGD